MKTISNILALFVATCGLLCAAGKPGTGFVRIVNAVSPGTGKAAFAINGRDLHAGGYALGQTTGEYGIKSGDHVITVRKTGVETGRVKIQLGAGETITVIAHAERLPQKNLDDPPRWVVRLLRLKQQDEAEGLTLSLISVCKPEETAVDLLFIDRDVTRKAFAKRLAITKVEFGRLRGEVFLKIKDRVLTSVSPDTPGNYVVVLYENQEGETRALSFYEPDFLVTY